MPRKSLFVFFALCALFGAVVLVPALLAPRTLAAPPGPPPRPMTTVRVDCDAGQTLAKAVATRAEALTVEFTGTCAEELVIARDQLTIRGLDASATVTDDPSTTGPDPSFLLQGADVVFESFTIDGSADRGIRVQRSSGIRVDHMTIKNTGTTGLTLEESSSAHISDSVLDGNGFAGVAAWGNSNVTLTGSLEVSDNGTAGLLLSTGSSFMNRNGTLIRADNESFGVGTQQGGTGLFPLIQADNSLFGVVAFGGSHVGPVAVTGAIVGVVVTNHGTFDGVTDVSASLIGVQLFDNSNGRLRGGTVTAPTGLDSFDSDTESTAVSFEGDLKLGFNAQAFFDGSTATGAVLCDPTAVAGGSISCPSPLTGATERLVGPREPAAVLRYLPLQQPN